MVKQNGTAKKAAAPRRRRRAPKYVTYVKQVGRGKYETLVAEEQDKGGDAAKK